MVLITEEYHEEEIEAIQEEENDIYSGSTTSEKLDADEITAEEEGFMRGYMEEE